MLLYLDSLEFLGILRVKIIRSNRLENIILDYERLCFRKYSGNFGAIMKKIFIALIVFLTVSQVMADIIIESVKIEDSAKDFVTKGGILTIVGIDRLIYTETGYSSNALFNETKKPFATKNARVSNTRGKQPRVTVLASVRPSKEPALQAHIFRQDVSVDGFVTNEEFAANPTKFTYRIIVSDYNEATNSIRIQLLKLADEV